MYLGIRFVLAACSKFARLPFSRPTLISLRLAHVHHSGGSISQEVCLSVSSTMGLRDPPAGFAVSIATLLTFIRQIFGLFISRPPVSPRLADAYINKLEEDFTTSPQRVTLSMRCLEDEFTFWSNVK
ncbi:unnamed protein product [Protopolystoma xenopodis]|uniref:Uncharacterized protein n=1 Tax=Protopolystoma xenopodis TaxID=117903 RepID=A0A448XPS9_9PLAT|nr:unnamed protein product [Protopolystoma xenopodis]